MRSKFSIGDRVSVNDRAPLHVELERHRPRTIVGTIRSDSGRLLYRVGSNGRGTSFDGQPQDGYNMYHFRASMLSRWNTTGVNGRPRKRRKYRRRKAGLRLLDIPGGIRG